MKIKKKKLFALIIKEDSKHKGEMGEVFNCDNDYISVQGLKREPDFCFFRPNEVRLFIETNLKEIKRKTGVTKKQIQKKIIEAVQNKL